MNRLPFLLLVGCATAAPGPTVSVTPFGGPWDADDIDDVMDGAMAWSDLGFIYELDPDGSGPLPVCPSDWMFTGVTDCRIAVAIEQVPEWVLPDGIAAWTDRANDVIQVRARFHGQFLQHLSAHEFGHVLLNTSLHLGPDVPGIMQATANGITEPTAADLALACVTTGICVD